MNKKNEYRAKEVLTQKWVYGNYISKVEGCVPLIVSKATMQDNGEVEFDYYFIDAETLEKVED